MGKKRKVFSGAFKAKVALEAIREAKTAAQIACEFQIHPAQVSRWKRQAVEGLAEILEDGRGNGKSRDETPSEKDLYEKIGRLQTELDWLKKKVHPTSAYRHLLIPRIFSLKYSPSRKPQAWRFIVLILLFRPSTDR